MPYTPNPSRYTNVPDGWFRRCGQSGVMLPALSLGFWHNFGDTADQDEAKRMCFGAFDLGITHFDLANNYGPPAGSAEENAGRIIKQMPRDELIISSKAGWPMWDGPYGDFGSRKYLLASLDQSLKRLGLDYVDIFYHHRPDPETPMEESLGALEHAVRSGKALYCGISSYDGEQTRRAVEIMDSHDWPRLLIHQPNYNMFDRWIEDDLIDACDESGLGMIVFCPLHQGVLTDKYLNGVPETSRAADKNSPFLSKDQVTQNMVEMARRLNIVAKDRGQSLAQMAIAWTLRDKRVTTALIGARNLEQITENVAAAINTHFEDEELAKIDATVGHRKVGWV